MENQNSTGQDLSQLKSMFADYQNKQSNSASGTQRVNLLTKYFVPRNPKEIFRIVPPKAGRKHIQEAFFHVLTTNASGGKLKHGTVIYCPAHNDAKVPKMVDGKPALNSDGNPILVPAPCPACAEYKRLLGTQDPSLKGVKKETMNDFQKKVKAKNDEIYKEAIKWSAKKFYIIRGIDKGTEKDGIKFWRFKHNYKNQGTLDKLLPILEMYMTDQQADFSDAQTGTDLNIIMTDAVFNGRTYKQISAITAKGKSPLHQDQAVMNAWLSDDISWRDVFKPKKAPNITPYQYLEMCVAGTTPYWDDSDQSNKKWVFPANPELQEKANTRTMNLDKDEDENFEQASDLAVKPQSNVTIGNVTANDVGTFQDNATNVGQQIIAEAKANTPEPTPPPQVTVGSDASETPDAEGDGDYEDLPF